jgi:ketosteroid isomerase-like protein
LVAVPRSRAGIYRGREETRRFWSTFFEAFDRIVVVPEEFIEHGDCVIVRDRARMWGRDGIEVEARNVAVVTLRDSRIVQWRLAATEPKPSKPWGWRRRRCPPTSLWCARSAQD